MRGLLTMKTNRQSRRSRARAMVSVCVCVRMREREKDKDKILTSDVGVDGLGWGHESMQHTHNHDKVTRSVGQDER